MQLRAVVVVGFLSLALSLSAQTNTSSASVPAISGSGSAGFIPIWTTATKLGNSTISESKGQVGIGVTTPTATLDVNGSVSATSFSLGANSVAIGSYSAQNAFLGFAGNTTTTGNNNTAVGYQAFLDNTTGFDNVAFGDSALLINNTGYENTATGVSALQDNGSGTDNVADGLGALGNNTSGGENTAVGARALASPLTDKDVTCIGYGCTAADAIINATAIGAHASVEQSHSLVLGGTGAWAVNVGIGTTTPSSVLTIGRGLGHPISDSWDTYSSRRWKSNIETLHGALQQVLELRGVSYDQKDSGKHEIGVIAEEVGAVVPEIVSWDKDSREAQGVDYGRLSALLIEATKEQQSRIEKQQAQIEAQQKEIAGLAAKVQELQNASGANK